MNDVSIATLDAELDAVASGATCSDCGDPLLSKRAHALGLCVACRHARQRAETERGEELFDEGLSPDELRDLADPDCPQCDGDGYTIPGLDARIPCECTEQDRPRRVKPSPVVAQSIDELEAPAAEDGVVLLRRHMAARGLSQRQAATELGLSESMLARWCDSVQIPAAHQRLHIEQWSHGAVPASSWPGEPAMVGAHLGRPPADVRQTWLRNQLPGPLEILLEKYRQWSGEHPTAAVKLLGGDARAIGAVKVGHEMRFDAPAEPEEAPGEITEPPRYSSPLSHVSSRGAMPVVFGRAPEKQYEPIPENIEQLAEEQDARMRAAQPTTHAQQIAELAPGRARRRKERVMRDTEETSTETEETPESSESADVPKCECGKALRGQASKESGQCSGCRARAAQVGASCETCGKQLRGPSVEQGKCHRCRVKAGEVEKPEPKKKPARASNRARRATVTVEHDTPAPPDPTLLNDDVLRAEHTRRFGEPAPRTVLRELTDDELRAQFWARGLFVVADVENLAWHELEAALSETEQRCAAGDAARARMRKMFGGR